MLWCFVPRFLVSWSSLVPLVPSVDDPSGAAPAKSQPTHDLIVCFHAPILASLQSVLEDIPLSTSFPLKVLGGTNMILALYSRRLTCILPIITHWHSVLTNHKLVIDDMECHFFIFVNSLVPPMVAVI